VKLIDLTIEIGASRRHIEWMELWSDRSAEMWSDIQAVRRAKDEIIIALTDVRQLERMQQAGIALTLGRYLTEFKKQYVLLAGDFSRAGKVRLRAIGDSLERQGYVPIMLDEIPESPDYDLLQKFSAIAPVCRFVVFDDSSKSGHLAEFPLAVAGRYITIVLRLHGSEGSMVTRGVASTSKVIRESEYSAGDLDAVVSNNLTWAEQRHDELRGDRGFAAFPWRQQIESDEPTQPEPD
jgi:hypothetical protein